MSKKAIAIPAIVDCGSSHYLIVYRYNNTNYSIDMDGNKSDVKVSSTAFLPVTATDMSKPEASLFYFGIKPNRDKEYAFIPNWKDRKSVV